MILTSENYYSDEANAAYMSVSQYKDFAGENACEERAMATIRGNWKEEMSTALLASSYVDAYFDNSLDEFKIEHPEIFTKTGELRSDYKQMHEIIKRIERDPYFLKCLDGEKQRIFTGTIFGIPWKGKMDVYIANRCIVDLKVMKSIRETIWSKNKGRVSFIEYYNYDIQAAIYQELVRINTGKKLPFLIAAASKENFTDIEVIGFDQDHLDMIFSGIFMGLARINDLKSDRGFVPKRCEVCDWCHDTKILNGPIHFKDL